MAITITQGKHRITLRSGTIGPHHDPYSSESLIIEPSQVAPLALDTAVIWETNGLGLQRLTMLQGGKKVRVLETFANTNTERRCWKTKFNLLAKRWTGIRLDDARDLIFYAESRTDAREPHIYC